MARRKRTEATPVEPVEEVKAEAVETKTEEIIEEPVKAEKPKRQAKKEEVKAEPEIKNLISTKELPESKDNAIKGVYKVTAAYALRMRNGAGADKGIMTEIAQGSKVTCDGEYTKANGVTWLLVTFTTSSDITYKGYCSGAYLRKI